MSLINFDRWRNRADDLPMTGDDIESELATITPEPVSILDKLGGQASRLLDGLRGQELALVEQIAERTETLRQVRVSIEAFTACERTIEAGKTQIAAE